MDTTERRQVHDLAGVSRLQRHVAELLGYLDRNQDALVHYAARRRRGEPSSIAFVESAVNEIVAKCMNKAQQMRVEQGDRAALPRRTRGRAERHARGRLSSTLSELPARKR